MWRKAAWSSALSRRKPWAAAAVSSVEKKTGARGPLEMDRKRGYRVVSYRIVAGQRGRRGSVRMRMRTQMGTRPSKLSCRCRAEMDAASLTFRSRS